MNTRKIYYQTNLIICIVISFILIPVYSFALDEKEYPSPDGKYKAIIINHKKKHATKESRIKILSSSVQIFTKDYSSSDGEHGFGVEKASWTPDSQFFVYSMYSSGGHQAWHFPTYCYSVAEKKVKLIDDYVGPITAPDFQVKTPHIIKISGQRKDDLEKSFNKEINLNKIVDSEQAK